MIRVVADTNIYVSALLFGGTPEEILLLAKADALSLYISDAIREELAGVLRAKFGWDEAHIGRALGAIAEFTILVHPKERLTTIREDEADNRILECALEARADAIVSGDRHLRKLRTFHGIPILTARAFLESIGEE